MSTRNEIDTPNSKPPYASQRPKLRLVQRRNGSSCQHPRWASNQAMWVVGKAFLSHGHVGFVQKGRNTDTTYMMFSFIGNILGTG